VLKFEVLKEPEALAARPEKLRLQKDILFIFVAYQLRFECAKRDKRKIWNASRQIAWDLEYTWQIKNR
jgi:hypothetical protein